MTQRYPQWLMTAAVMGLLVIGPVRGRAAEPDKLLPAEAEIVVQINYKQILESELIKKYALEQMKQALQNQDAKKLLDELGLDPFRDIHRIIIAGEIRGRGEEGRYLMIGYGSFDPEKLFATAEAYSKKNPDRFSLIRDGDTVMFKFQPDSGQMPVYATVLDDKTVVAGSDKKIVMNAVAASRSNKKPPIKPELTALLKKMDEKASIYACALVKGKFDDVNIPQGAPIDLTRFQELLPKMETLSLAFRIGKDVKMEVNMGMSNEDAADEMNKAMKNLLNDIKPLLQLATAADPRTKPLTDVVNSIKVNTKSKEVTLTGEISEANIQRMIKPDDDGQP
ncbi:MAG: hypothetical protein NZ703_11125 [Gemmataceae bacterium]|nr:hypothetical protein [Gemmataceae bacterium]MCS7271624.1 hypothetical protein [Gemmataceae bacterium]MDW8241660.1 hypothetical protein [Thermogemmata sp.]